MGGIVGGIGRGGDSVQAIQDSSNGRYGRSGMSGGMARPGGMADGAGLRSGLGDGLNIKKYLKKASFPMSYKQRFILTKYTERALSPNSQHAIG